MDRVDRMAFLYPNERSVASEKSVTLGTVRAGVIESSRYHARRTVQTDFLRKKEIALPPRCAI